MIETFILDQFTKYDIAPCVAVPCKFFSKLLVELAEVSERQLIFPAREEEGLGICAGAHLAGHSGVMIIQNSGLGNLVNAYCSLNNYFNIPVCFLVSHRGGPTEPVEAQKPFGEITEDLLALLQIKAINLHSPDQQADFEMAMELYCREKQSVALLTQPSFWQP